MEALIVRLMFRDMERAQYFLALSSEQAEQAAPSHWGPCLRSDVMLSSDTQVELIFEGFETARQRFNGAPIRLGEARRHEEANT